MTSTDSVDPYARLFAAMDRGLLVTINESDEYTSGAGEMKVLGSNKDGTVVDFEQGNDIFTAKLENERFHLYKRVCSCTEERHWCEIVTIEVVGVAN